MNLPQEPTETTSLTPDYFRERVKAGIAFLDEEAKVDWKESIDLSRFYMAHDGLCILGQLYRNYFIGFEKLDIKDNSTAANLGLSLRKDHLESLPNNASRLNAWAVLTQCWREELWKLLG